MLCSLFALVTAMSCGSKGDPAVHPLTEDERHLIDTYIIIIGARDLYSRNPSMAESLFTAIDSTTDSLRMANTITAINQTPERWLFIFEILDTRIQKLSQKEAE
jgi:hypothetical protein